MERFFTLKSNIYQALYVFKHFPNVIQPSYLFMKQILIVHPIKINLK